MGEMDLRVPFTGTTLGKVGTQLRLVATALSGATFAVYDTVANAEASFAAPIPFCYVDETITNYGYIAAGGAYTIDHVTVLATADGGDTRLVAYDLLA